MTPDQFAYWLQGFAEINSAAPTQEQWQAIRDHLALVFDKRTPEIKPPPLHVEPPRRHEELPRAHEENAAETLDALVRHLRRRQKLRDREPTRVLLC